MNADSSSHYKLFFANKVNIRNINELHAELLSALLRNNSVELDFSGCTEADLSFIQLIESARIYARTAARELRLSAPATGTIAALLERGGFLESPAPEDLRFWFHEGV